jgi:hypothetical protein
MAMSMRNAWALPCLMVFALVAGPVLAHGWAAPPPPPAGGGNPTAQPAAGGGGDANSGTATGGGNANSGTATGGGDPTASEPPASSGSGSASSGTQAPPRPTLATSSVRSSGSAAPKQKKAATPWMDRIHIPWAVGFLPSVGNTGYATRVGTVADALRLPPSQGGWVRDQRPVLVLEYDAADVEQRKLIDALDADGKVRSAAQFFDCFRVDLGAKAKKGETKDARLSVYTHDGTLVGEVVGQRKLAGAYDLLATAWAKRGGSNFADRVAKMDTLLKTKAYAEHYVPLCEVGIVCPDCGEERHDVIERAAEYKARAEACDRAMADLVARN